MIPEFHGPQLERISQFCKTTLGGMEAAQRWKKYVEKGATPSQHTFTASLLALLIVNALMHGRHVEVPTSKKGIQA